MVPVRSSHLARLLALAALVAWVGPASAQAPRLTPTSAPVRVVDRPSRLPVEASAAAAPAPDWTLRLDPVVRALALGGSDFSGGGADARMAGDGVVDVFVQTTSHDAVRAAGVEVRATAGDVAVVRVRRDDLYALATNPAVRFVEASYVRERLNDSGRADTRADAVHAGTGLPTGYRGNGVVVGVLDSGIDVTHPDFFNGSGSRIRFLLEFLQGGGQTVYTKAQIDANPAAIPERDGNGGMGHGTHVTGSAAGAGTGNAAMRGIAPEADIVFVKGVRHPDSQGGFADADVVSGVDFIFQRAAELGRPAVVNLSLGGHLGSPHDGTSLYEQALSNLGGPGRIVVAAAGNDGFSFIHAGENVPGGNTENETVILPSNPDQVVGQLWYDAGAQNRFGIAAYFWDGVQLNYLTWVSVQAGQIHGNGGQPVPLVYNGTPLGSVYIDASATQDPRNGDGNVFFAIVGGNGIDIRNVVWSVVSLGPSASRNDAWLSGGEFLAGTGFLPPPINEVPGNRDMTIGTPSTALGLISVGSHVTNNDWVDLDGQFRQWQNPNPDGNPNSPPVVPTLGQRSYFSSRGPTRDGRTYPHLTAPGEYIFSPLSSHLTLGQGVQRYEIAQGGGYRGMQGTSMASPMVTGIVALMLDADPSLTPTEARQILQQTARTDGHTGGVPNNLFGAGKADALAAVQRTLELCGSSCTGGGTGTSVTEAEPNNSVAQAQLLAGASPITATGAAQHSDVGGLTVSYQGGVVDDFEDLYRITTTTTGLSLALGSFNRDLDLFLLNSAGTQIVASSNQAGETTPEAISQPSLPPGTYLVAVSFYDGTGETGQTAYGLVATGSFSVDAEDDPDASGLVLRTPAPNPSRGSAEVTFALPAPQTAHVAVFDVLGREVARLADGPFAAGTHTLAVDGLAAGVYVVRLRADAGVRAQTLVVAR